VTWRDGPRVERVLRGDEPGVLHLHGRWQDPRSVVLGIRSYEDVLGSAHAQSVQQALRLFNSLVFVGFGGGLADPNFGTFLRWTRTVFGGSEYRHFRLARADDAGRLQQEHPPDERIVVLPYGARHEDLVSFLRALRPVDAPAEPGRPAERTGLTDLERRILRTLFARYPEDDSINVRSVGEVEHVADPGSPHLWDLHREPGLLEALARLNDLMLIKFEVSESGFARAILLPDGISALRGEYRDHTSPPLVLVVGVPDGTTGTRSVGPRPLSDAVEIEIGKEWYPSTAAVPVVDETRDDAAVGALSEAIRTGEVLGRYGVLRIVNSGDIDLARCKVVLTRLQRYDPDPASLAWKAPAWFGQAGGHALHWSAAHGGGAVQSLGPQEVRSCDFVCFEDMGHDHALIVTADDGLRSTRKLDFGLWRATCRVEADGWAPVDVRLRLRWDREPQPGIPRALNIRLDEE